MYRSSAIGEKKGEPEDPSPGTGADRGSPADLKFKFGPGHGGAFNRATVAR